MKNNSPWINQTASYPTATLDNTDVLIIGAGISGLTTAYFLLRDTNRRVLIIDQNKVGQGASGHNAGQAVCAFEEEFMVLAKQFGAQAVADTERMMYSSWDLLKEINETIGLQQVEKINGYMGFCDYTSFQRALENDLLRKKHGIDWFTNYVPLKTYMQLPAPYASIATLCAVEELDALQTSLPCVAMQTTKVGLLNTHTLCITLVRYLAKAYADRFGVVEHTSVQRIEGQIGSTMKGDIKFQDVVVCTNGYIDLLPQHISVTQRSASMIGYSCPTSATFANVYHYEGEQYYATAQNGFIAVGGGRNLETFAQYLRFQPSGKIQHWSGYLAYTNHNVRIIGADRYNKHIYYNLGCNGIGLLPSIFGGFRASRILKGDCMPPCIFDLT